MMMHKLAFAALAAVCFGSTALAESSVSDVVSTLAARPPMFVGACPAQITFSGSITARGNIDPRAPLEMGYTFVRSDGAAGPIQYYTINAPGTQTVNTSGTVRRCRISTAGVYPVEDSWTLGGPQLPRYQGWQQLKVWPTRHEAGYVFSPRAEFRLMCH